MTDAARLLHEAHVLGAPVVDDHGTCIGVLSAADFVRLVEQPVPFPSPDPELPITCGFQYRRPAPLGKEETLCTLAANMCPLQQEQPGEKGTAILCREPNCVPADWQIVNPARQSSGRVRRHMTLHPITVELDTPILEAARQMLEARIHRLIVVDAEHRPAGVLSATDVLAALVCPQEAMDHPHR
jgi:CBS domain-containing protein